MKRNPVVIWITVSIIFLIVGIIWSNIDAGDGIGFLIYSLAWISTLLAIGYYSTPDNSMYGKIAFAAVVVMVAGMVMKVLHLSGGNEIIVFCLLLILATYITRWVREKKVF